MTKLRLGEFERDLLRTANSSLEAAQIAVARAEAAWKEVLDHVLKLNEVESDKMKTMVLQEDFKFLVIEPKETEDGPQVHQDRRPE